MTTMAPLSDKSITLIPNQSSAGGSSRPTSSSSTTNTTTSTPTSTPPSSMVSSTSAKPRDIPLVVSSTPTSSKPLIVSSSIDRRDSYGNGTNGGDGLYEESDFEVRSRIDINGGTGGGVAVPGGSGSAIAGQPPIPSTSGPSVNDIYGYNYAYDGYAGGYYVNGSTRSHSFVAQNTNRPQLVDRATTASSHDDLPSVETLNLNSGGMSPLISGYNSASTSTSAVITDLTNTVNTGTAHNRNGNSNGRDFESTPYSASTSVSASGSVSVSQSSPRSDPAQLSQEQKSISQPGHPSPIPPPPVSQALSLMPQTVPLIPPFQSSQQHHSSTPFIYSSDIATFRPNHHYHNDTYTITVTNVPPNYQWKQLRSVISSASPTISIIYTKIVTPGIALITVKGQANALSCVQALNGLLLPTGHVLVAAASTAAAAASTLTPGHIPVQVQQPQHPLPSSLSVQQASLTHSVEENGPSTPSTPSGLGLTGSSSANSPRSAPFRSLNISQTGSPLPLQSSPLIFSPAVSHQSLNQPQQQQQQQYFSSSGFPLPPQPNPSAAHQYRHPQAQPPPPPSSASTMYPIFSPQSQNASLSSNPYQQSPQPSADLWNGSAPPYYGQSYIPQQQFAIMNSHLPYHHRSAAVSDRQRLFIGNVSFPSPQATELSADP